MCHSWAIRFRHWLVMVMCVFPQPFIMFAPISLAEELSEEGTATVLIEKKEKICLNGEACWERAGSGFFSDPEGWIVTADHVLHPNGPGVTATYEYRIRIGGVDGEPKGVTFHSSDKEKDIACLKYTKGLKEELDFIPVGDPGDVLEKDWLRVIGFPRNSGLREFEVKLLSKRLDRNNRGLWLTEIGAAAEGDSGGPVIDVKGGLAVAIEGRAEPVGNQNYVVPLLAKTLQCLQSVARRNSPVKLADFYVSPASEFKIEEKNFSCKFDGRSIRTFMPVLSPNGKDNHAVSLDFVLTNRSKSDALVKAIELNVTSAEQVAGGSPGVIVANHNFKLDLEHKLGKQTWRLRPIYKIPGDDTGAFSITFTSATQGVGLCWILSGMFITNLGPVRIEEFSLIMSNF